MGLTGHIIEKIKNLPGHYTIMNLKNTAKLAKNKKVLNCFSYTGGFSVMAGIGGAQKVDSVDISDPAIELAKENFCLNDLDIKHNSFIVEDVFEFLRKDSVKNIYDFIILEVIFVIKDVVQQRIK